MLTTPEIKSLIDERKKGYWGLSEGETIMKLDQFLVIAKKHVECPECRNKYIGDGQGTLEVDETTYRRTCKCGWSHEETVDEKEES